LQHLQKLLESSQVFVLSEGQKDGFWTELLSLPQGDPLSTPLIAASSERS